MIDLFRIHRLIRRARSVKATDAMRREMPMDDFSRLRAALTTDGHEDLVAELDAYQDGETLEDRKSAVIQFMAADTGRIPMVLEVIS